MGPDFYTTKVIMPDKGTYIYIVPCCLIYPFLSLLSRNKALNSVYYVTQKQLLGSSYYMARPLLKTEVPCLVSNVQLRSLT